MTNDDIQLATLFDSLKTGQLVTVSFTSCMGRTNTDGVQLRVGRRTHSKKYNVTTIFLERVDGRRVPTWVKPKLLMRHNDNRRVSMSHGDMAVQLHSITVNT